MYVKSNFLKNLTLKEITWELQEENSFIPWGSQKSKAFKSQDHAAGKYSGSKLIQTAT